MSGKGKTDSTFLYLLVPGRVNFPVCLAALYGGDPNGI